MAIFSDELFKNKNLSTFDNILSNLTYYHEQLHLLHFQTESYSEHKALDKLYKFVFDIKDEIIEKLIGYTGIRPSINKYINIGKRNSKDVVSDLINFANQLKEFSEKNKYNDISNLSDSLSGKASQTLYLLTLK